jgi:hypothetical protein
MTVRYRRTEPPTGDHLRDSPQPSSRLSTDHPSVAKSHTRPRRLTLSAAIEDVQPQCGRELCVLARVYISGTQEPSRSSDDDFPRAVVTSPPTHRRLRVRVRRLSRPTASILGDPRAGSAFEAPGPVLGTFLARPRDCAACCRGHRAPAFQRRSLWLDQASARRALAVPPRGSSDASTTAATSSRCSPELSVRSRRLLGAAA